MGRLGWFGILCVGTGLLCRGATAEEGRTVAGVVHHADGSPAAQVAVVLEIGRARLSLGEDLDRWASVKTDRGTSDASGAFRFTGVPEGASLLVWAKTQDAFASAPGGDNVALTLAPLGSVTGKATGKPALLKGLRVVVSGGGGLAHADGKVEEDAGRFDVHGVVPGDGALTVYRGNFPVARATVQVVAGEQAKAKPVRVADGFLPSADPLVDVTKVRLVDAQGHPVAGVQLWWSSQWMDGGMSSDEDGIVRLAGGGVAIGGPPYYLRLSSLQKETSAFQGVLKGARGGAATLELQPLVEVSGTVSVGGKRADLYHLHAVAAGKPPRVVAAAVKEGRYTVQLAPGPSRVVVGTLDGTLHETTVEVAPSTSSLTRDLTLP